MGFLDFLPLIGTGINAISGAISQGSANSTNVELAKYNWEQQKEMWRMNNEYNTPANQMQRYMDAGLNPNLVTGFNAGNSTSVPTPQQAHVDPIPVPDFGNSLNQVVGNIRADKVADSQAKYNDAAADAKKQEAQLTSFRIIAQQLENAKTTEGKEFWKDIARAQRDKLVSEAGLTVSQEAFFDATFDSRLKALHTTAENLVKDGKIKTAQEQEKLANIVLIGENVLYLQKRRQQLEYELSTNPDPDTVKKYKTEIMRLDQSIKGIQEYVLDKTKDNKILNSYMDLFFRPLEYVQGNASTIASFVKP